MLALEWNMNDALQARLQDGRNYERNEERKAVHIKNIPTGKTLQEIHADTDLPIERILQLATDYRENLYYILRVTFSVLGYLSKQAKKHAFISASTPFANFAFKAKARSFVSYS